MRAVLRYYAANFTRDLELTGKFAYFCLHRVHRKVTALYVKFSCDTAFLFGFKHCVKGCYEESEARKVTLGDS